MEDVMFKEVLKEVDSACSAVFGYTTIDNNAILECATQIYISLRKGDKQ